MTCDVIGIAQYYFLKSKMAAMYFCTMSKFKSFLSQFTLENAGNRTKAVLVTLIALNKSNLSKILMLWFMS